MKIFNGALIGACLLALAGSVAAQDGVGNGVPQPRIGKAKKLSVQECTDRAAASAPGKKDAATAQQDRYCAKLLKKEAAKKP